LLCCPGLSGTPQPPALGSPVAGITVVHHHTQVRDNKKI
jgi:hypothetical protein